MNIFETVKGARVNKTKFNLSHERKFSMKMGKLVPILVEEVLPGDEYKINAETMIRLAPLISPMMHRVDAYVHFFYVPNRLVWDEWEDFITGKENITVPQTYCEHSAAKPGSIWDYMGIPTEYQSHDLIGINELPFRAYNKIYNDYYRDENLQDEEPIKEISDGDPPWKLHDRAWEKDYFTSALPWAQKGGEVEMPLNAEWSPNYHDKTKLRYTSSDVPVANKSPLKTDSYGMITASGALAEDVYVDNLEGEQEVTGGIEINAFRKAMALQKWLERNARAGTRYVEHLLSHWGVKSSDARLDRAEYIGGGKSPVVISEVLNTMDDGQAPSSALGSMAGHGINVGKTNTAYKKVEEHGYIIGIMSVLPATTYQQGLHRGFSRQTFDDYYFPEFANLGEQEVKNKEIYFQGHNMEEMNDATFGYQSRYAEYRYKQSSVHGDFRDSLDFWHMGRKFANLPALNEDFIKADPRTDVFAVDDGTDQLWVNLYNNITANRPMPYYATPK